MDDKLATLFPVNWIEVGRTPGLENAQAWDDDVHTALQRNADQGFQHLAVIPQVMPQSVGLLLLTVSQTLGPK